MVPTIDEEMDLLQKNKTWIVVLKQKNKSIMEFKWILKVKERINENGPIKIKASGFLDEEIYMNQPPRFNMDDIIYKAIVP
uniref:Uncharacterized protein n=1 Tax=Cannabis sativa TaxID=3483 RepID=A0A803PK62_CANSA